MQSQSIIRMCKRLDCDELKLGYFWTFPLDKRNQINQRSLRSKTKSLSNLRHRSHCREMGIWYDFPKCCIEQFLQHRGYNTTRHQEMTMEYNQYVPYIPCISCTKKFYHLDKAKETNNKKINNISLVYQLF